MYCTYCGKQVDDNAEVCEFCGGYLNRTNEAPVAEEAAPQKVTYSENYNQNNQYSQNNQSGYQAPQGEQKSKMIAGLLGILLGGFGVHNFYLGYTGKGIAQILLTFCCGIGYIWGIIEGILILVGTIKTDANGVPLAD